MCRNCFKPLELVAENIGFISTSFCPSQLSLDKALKLAIQIVFVDCGSLRLKFLLTKVNEKFTG